MKANIVISPRNERTTKSSIGMLRGRGKEEEEGREGRLPALADNF